MDEEDFFSSRPQDPLTQLIKQDLGPLSVDELQERIATLKGEIARIEQHLTDTAGHTGRADELFKIASKRTGAAALWGSIVRRTETFALIARTNRPTFSRPASSPVGTERP
jgi:uncharacterized small protein (DUF1192 family)